MYVIQWAHKIFPVFFPPSPKKCKLVNKVFYFGGYIPIYFGD